MTTTAAPPRGTLYVDMDGVIFASDSIWEAVMRLAKQRPAVLFMLPIWLMRGRAYLKQQVFSHVDLQVSTLPFRREVIDLLRQEHESGRRLVLATAGDRKIADSIAAHLGFFDSVLASDGTTNLKGARKRRAIEADAAGQPWDYIGDSHADLDVWSGCSNALIAGARPRLLRRAHSAGLDPKIVSKDSPILPGLIRALRPHQWTKNVLVAVPLIVSHQVRHRVPVIQTLVAFVVFCLVASSAYLLNDMLDLPADRAHHTKRNRPFASGALSIPVGLIATFSMLLCGLLLAGIALGGPFLGIVALYACLTIAYSLDLKRRLVLDVFVLAMLYGLRVVAGAVAIRVEPSAWLLAFATFTFISLAFIKRYAELTHARNADLGHAAGRGYSVHDVELFRSFGPASAYMAALVFCLYINSPDVTKLYTRPQLLWLVCPILLYWLTRLWFLADRGYRMEDPVLFAVRDRVSYICAACVLLLIILAV